MSVTKRYFMPALGLAAVAWLLGLLLAGCGGGGGSAPHLVSQIAFESWRDGVPAIYVMDADGSNQTRLTDDTAFDIFPAWSPDGSQIAFATIRYDDNFEICVMDADGSNPINLTNNPAGDWTASWSPDGDKIAFASDRDGNYEVYVMDADGGNPINLINNAAYDCYPSWGLAQGH